jgi:hypothetical protein
VVLVLHAELDPGLPEHPSTLAFALSLFSIVIPWIVARAVARYTGTWLQRGARPSRLLRVLLLAQLLIVPLCYAIVVFAGALPQVVARAVPESELLRFGALTAPLLAMEVGMRLSERRTVQLLEHAGLRPPAWLGPERLPTVLLIVVPFALLCIVADALAWNRGVWVFFHRTALGTTVGLLLVVVVLCVSLPFVFCGVMPVSRRLPPHLASDLRHTAALLGFKGSAVLSMRTGHRVINAALVGPAPWPRFLILTDGLLAFLEPHALRGVVAHEVGHARANHPALLVLMFAVIPLLLLQPILAVPADALGAGAGVLIVAACFLGWLVLRVLAHRFEYEADQLSAEALGDAEACVRALRRVGQLSPQGFHRSSFRHPSEEKRIRNLYACERDPHHRARFWRRGRTIRNALYASALLAAGLNAWVHVDVWPLDRASYFFHCGRFVEAREVLDALPPDLPAPDAEVAQQMRAEIDAARTLGFTSGSWSEVSRALAARALQRAGEMVTSGADPEKIAAMLSLALNDRAPEPWVEALYLLYRARSQEHDESFARIRQHVLGLDAPSEIQDAVRAMGDR